MSPYKKDFLENINRYPFFHDGFFKGLVKRAWQVERSGAFYHLFDKSEHYFFDTSNFSIKKWYQWTNSSYGIQYTEWLIRNQLYNISQCNIHLIQVLDQLNTYLNVQLRGSPQKIPCFINHYPVF
jgi:hypothetical protein